MRACFAKVAAGPVEQRDGLTVAPREKIARDAKADQS
jgi:hypothetical protein